MYIKLSKYKSVKAFTITCVLLLVVILVALACDLNALKKAMEAAHLKYQTAEMDLAAHMSQDAGICSLRHCGCYCRGRREDNLRGCNSKRSHLEPSYWCNNHSQLNRGGLRPMVHQTLL